MFGRSLSFCVRDIAEGKIKLSDVDMIVTSTKIESNEDFNEVLNGYSNSYWYNNPEKCKKIALNLWESGKIYQPRLFDDSLSQDLRKSKHWVKRLEDCTYYPED